MNKISNFKFQISNFERGFTLIELLIVVGMIGSVLSIVLGIAASTLRGANKTNVINKVRENGNYAIFQVSRTIRYAKAIDGASVDGSPPWSCQLMPLPLTPTPTPIQYKFVRIKAFDETTTTFACEVDTISSNAIPIIDGGPTGFVSLNPGSCFFTCRRERITDPLSIGINFTLTANTTSTLFEANASVPFSTLIKAKN